MEIQEALSGGPEALCVRCGGEGGCRLAGRGCYLWDVYLDAEGTVREARLTCGGPVIGAEETDHLEEEREKQG